MSANARRRMVHLAARAAHFQQGLWSCPRKPNTKLHTARPRRNSLGDIILSPLWG